MEKISLALVGEKLSVIVSDKISKQAALRADTIRQEMR